MYNHRIVPDGIMSDLLHRVQSYEEPAYWERYTIPITSEWTAQKLKALVEMPKSMWDEIGLAYRPYSRKLAKTYIPLGQFISELLPLVPLKGLTIEQIKGLKK